MMLSASAANLPQRLVVEEIFMGRLTWVEGEWKTSRPRDEMRSLGTKRTHGIIGLAPACEPIRAPWAIWPGSATERQPVDDNGLHLHWRIGTRISSTLLSDCGLNFGPICSIS